MKEKISLSILGRGVVSLSAVDHVNAQCRLVHGPAGYSTLVCLSCGECPCRHSAPLMLLPLMDAVSFARS